MKSSVLNGNNCDLIFFSLEIEKQALLIDQPEVYFAEMNSQTHL